jgi:signal transduction histidine kinase
VRSYGEHPLFVLRDRNAIRQVLRNLIDNACKYSPRDGHIHLQVTAQGKNACVRVRDHGPGVSAEDREQLFERFFAARTNQATPKAAPGWVSGSPGASPGRMTASCASSTSKAKVRASSCGCRS